MLQSKNKEKYLKTKKRRQKDKLLPDNYFLRGHYNAPQVSTHYRAGAHDGDSIRFAVAEVDIDSAGDDHDYAN